MQSLPFATASDEDRARTRASWDKKDVVFSVLILSCIIAAYVYFSG
jgi:SSS family solute:Na+ symporter